MALAGMFGPLGGAVMRAQNFAMTGQTGVAPTPEMAEEMEKQFQQIMQDARTALREHADIVKALVALILEKEELLADEIRAFFDQYGLFTPDPTTIRDGEEISLLMTGKEVVAADSAQ
jgi:ATP-dependent Zn protease